jgi:hypothetical protein
MRAPHPAEPRPNRFQAQCCHCRYLVNAGNGLTEKLMGTTNGWRTYHISCGEKAVANTDATPASPLVSAGRV